MKVMLSGFQRCEYDALVSGFLHDFDLFSEYLRPSKLILKVKSSQIMCFGRRSRRDNLGELRVGNAVTFLIC